MMKIQGEEKIAQAEGGCIQFLWPAFVIYSPMLLCCLFRGFIINLCFGNEIFKHFDVDESYTN